MRACKRSVALPRAPGATVRAAQQKCPNAPREAAAGEGGLGASSTPGVRDSIPRAGPSLPAQSALLLIFSTPAGNQQDVPGAGPESLQQGWEARSDRFDVRGWGPARPPRGASKRAAFRPVRASDLARTLRAPGGRAAESRTPLAQGTERKRPSRRSRRPPPRARRYCARKGSGRTAPAAGDLARPRARFPSGPRGARVAG